MESLWSELIMPRFAPLEGNIKTDVLVIGGGMVNTITAISSPGKCFCKELLSNTGGYAIIPIVI